MADQGPQLRGLTIGDDPSVWAALGFTVRGDRVRLGPVTVHLDGTGGGVRAWDLDPAPSTALDGLAQRAAGRVEATDHPNGVTGVDHLVVATRDHGRTAAALATHGLTARRTVDGARGDVATRYRFTLLGTCVLEVIGPVEPDPDDDGRARFVGLALVADRLDRFGPHAGAVKDAVQPGRRIVTLRTTEVGGTVPVAVLTPRPR